MRLWPSAELKPLRPRWARAGLDLLWWLLFALALVAVVGGIWRGYAEFRATAAFAQLGLQAQTDQDTGCVVVIPVTKTARAAWPRGISARKGGCLIEVENAPVDTLSRLPDVAARLQRPENGSAQVELQKPGAQLSVPAKFPRLAANVPQTRPPIWDWLEAVLIAASATVSLLYAGVALVLRRKRPDDPVSSLISFAFVLMAHIGTVPEAFWFLAGMDGWNLLLGIFIGQSLLLIAAPAFPNGTYVPGWARWLKWLVPVLLVPALVPQSEIATLFSGGALILLLPALCVALLFQRYFRMPDGLEKQQVKWAVFGLTLGLLLVLISFVAPTPSLGLARTNPSQFAWLSALSDLLRVVGYGLIPAGVGSSLLGYRLNDADLVVGKSLGYAIVTAIILVTWTAGQALLSDAAKGWFGTTTVAPAITALIPVLLFAPTRAWVLSWTEARFQPALVKLRKLPDKLARWEAYRTPDEVADAALADIVNGVGASYAAMLGDDGREWRVLAARGIEADKAMVQLENGPPAAAGGVNPFPIRRNLDDQIDRPDLLAIGPRSDGASFTKDERAAIAMILEPLSNALQASALRQRHTLRVESSLTGIDHRLARLERELAPTRTRRR